MGQSLTLECSITTVRGITSRVDIVWSSNGSELKRIEGLNHSSITNDSVLYTEFYTIPQLSSLDEYRTITCELFVNTLSPVTVTDSVALNVTGKCNVSNNNRSMHYSVFFEQFLISISLYYHLILYKELW